MTNTVILMILTNFRTLGESESGHPNFSSVVRVDLKVEGGTSLLFSCSIWHFDENVSIDFDRAIFYPR